MPSLDKPLAFNLRHLIQTHQKVIEVSHGFVWVGELSPFNHRLGQLSAQATLMVKAGQCCVSRLCRVFVVQRSLL